jgi:hypothetical protein
MLANYDLLNLTYHSGQMKENVQLLKKFDAFHCLLAGNSERAAAVKKRVVNLSEDFIKWLEVCDGGMLFDTTILTTKSHDEELNLDFETYSSYYNAEIRKGIKITDDYFIFAVAVHSDVYFFDLKKKDGKVYQWDIEEKNIYTTWDNFNDWLIDQIQEAVGLIADDLLMPFQIKLEINEDE